MAETGNIWIWIGIAIIGSILILLIIIGILYKVLIKITTINKINKFFYLQLNFFARPMKEKLLSEEANKNERVGSRFLKQLNDVYVPLIYFILGMYDRK